MARITFSTAVVLQAIDSGHLYGFDIMEATGLPSGTVYPALRRLERNGHLASDWEDRETAHAEQRPPRRYYTVAAAGRTALDAARRRYHGLDRMLATGSGERPGG